MRKEYREYQPSPQAHVRANILRVAFAQLHDLIEQEVPSSRERSLALTHLQTSHLFAGCAVAAGEEQGRSQSEVAS